MKAVITALAFAAALAGQPVPVKPAAAVAPSPVVRSTPAVELAVIKELETSFEQKVKHLDAEERFQLLGAASGVYLRGYGVVFTVPLDLIDTPPITIGRSVITPAHRKMVHEKKTAHLPLFRKAIMEMAILAAGSVKPLPPGEKIVIAARLFYFDWEDCAGLPSVMIATASRAGALGSEEIKLEEQE